MNSENRYILQRTLELQGPMPTFAEIGKKVFVIETKAMGDSTVFTEKCPVCDDTRKVTIRGFEFKCPHCMSGGFAVGAAGATTVRIKKYHVEEYIVHQITLAGPDTKKSYGSGAKSCDDYPSVKEIGAFQRTANGYANVRTISVTRDNRFIDPKPSDAADPDRLSSFYFTKKSLAEEVQRLLMEKEKQKLDRFNKEHNTNHAFPY